MTLAKPSAAYDTRGVGRGEEQNKNKNRNRKPSPLQLRVVGYILIRVIARKGQQQIFRVNLPQKNYTKRKGALTATQPGSRVKSSQIGAR